MKLNQLIEDKIPGHIVQSILDWQSGDDYDSAWNNARHDWQKQLIQYMRGRQLHIEGTLYRATACPDETTKALMQGQSVTVEPSKSLLESWAKTPAHAAAYFENLLDQDVSSLLFGMPANQLDVVFDVDVLGSQVEEPGEILVKVAPRRIGPENILAMVYDDYDGTGEVTYLAGANRPMGGRRELLNYMKTNIPGRAPWVK